MWLGWCAPERAPRILRVRGASLWIRGSGVQGSIPWRVSTTEVNVAKFNHERLRRARLHIGMSKEQLAVHLDVSLSTIERWEWGKTQPNATQLAVIAKRLNRDAGYFLRNDRVSA